MDELANNDTKVVPDMAADRQGRPGDSPRQARDVRIRIATPITEGKSLDEAVGRSPWRTSAPGSANEEQNANFVRVICRSLKP